jgi:hypothetical protein
MEYRHRKYVLFRNNVYKYICRNLKSLLLGYKQYSVLDNTWLIFTLLVWCVSCFRQFKFHTRRASDTESVIIPIILRTYFCISFSIYLSSIYLIYDPINIISPTYLFKYFEYLLCIQICARS